MFDQKFLEVEGETVAYRDVGFNQLRVSTSRLWVFSPYLPPAVCLRCLFHLLEFLFHGELLCGLLFLPN